MSEVAFVETTKLTSKGQAIFGVENSEKVANPQICKGNNRC